MSHGVLDHLADPELGGRVLVLVREAGDEPDVRAELQPGQRPVEGLADGRRVVRGGERGKASIMLMTQFRRSPVSPSGT